MSTETVLYDETDSKYATVTEQTITTRWGEGPWTIDEHTLTQVGDEMRDEDCLTTLTNLASRWDPVLAGKPRAVMTRKSELVADQEGNMTFSKPTITGHVRLRDLLADPLYGPVRGFNREYLPVHTITRIWQDDDGLYMTARTRRQTSLIEIRYLNDAGQAAYDQYLASDQLADTITHNGTTYQAGDEDTLMEHLWETATTPMNY